MPSSAASVEEQVEGFKWLFDHVGLTLHDYQEEIVREAFSGRRELLVMLPRGNGKSTLFATLALYELLTATKPKIFLAGASYQQARVMLEMAQDMVKESRELSQRLVVRFHEIRKRSGGGYIRAIASDAPKRHGLVISLALVDELHAHEDDQLYVALRTAMHKIPGSRMVTISTAGISGVEGPLLRLRERALAQSSVTRTGPRIDAHGPSLSMLEWSVPEGADVDDMAVVNEANPAPWITEVELQEQYESVPRLEFRRYHANQWTAVAEFWLPEGAWQQCAADYEIEPGESVAVGIDIGGELAASAVVWATEDLRVGVEIYQGERALFRIIEKLEELANTYRLSQVNYDPWRFQQAAMTFEEMRLPMAEFPQSHSRMVPASERLYEAVVSERIKQPNDHELNRHVASAVAKQTPRGWRLDKSAPTSQIDGVVALAMAVDAAAEPPSVYESRGVLAI